MWANNLGESLGTHPTAYYGATEDDPNKQIIIYHHRLISIILSMWIKSSLTTDAKGKLRALKNSYTHNNQDDGSEIFFVIVKMVRPDTRSGLSYINKICKT